MGDRDRPRHRGPAHRGLGCPRSCAVGAHRGHRHLVDGDIDHGLLDRSRGGDELHGNCHGDADGHVHDFIDCVRDHIIGDRHVLGQCHGDQRGWNECSFHASDAHLCDPSSDRAHGVNSHSHVTDRELDGGQ